MAAKRQAIEATGTQLAFVHMGSEKQADDFFASYGLSDVARISDPSAELYQAFNLKRGGLREIFNLKVWTRGFEAAILKGHSVGMLVGDGFQMPGVFLVHRGQILREFRHETVADLPDYESLAVCPIQTG